MQNKISLLWGFYSLVVAFWLWSVPSCSAEKTYILTETQRQELLQEYNLQRTLLQQLEDSKKKLQAELLQHQNELKLLEAKSISQELLLDSSQQALTDAKKSYSAYQKQIARRERRHKWQKRFYAALALGMTKIAINKHK